jgi:uncharacterized membrane protein
MIIMAVIMIVVAPIMIVVAPILLAIIVTALVAIRMGSPFGFLGVGVAICYLYQFTSGRGPLEV